MSRHAFRFASARVASAWLLAVVPSVLAPAAAANAEDSTRSEPAAEGPEAVVRALTRAIDYFDLEGFTASFSDDVTMFYPIAALPRRVDGRETLGAVQKRVFDGLAASFRESGKTEPPYFGLKPADVRVQRLGEGVAVVTWHVDRGTHLGRRTAVLERRDEGWLIVSYHASNLEKPED